tara:strand:- start:15 stop:491 length:477 start_codon:yes stop_codon:yes gene_type:complete
LETLSQSYGSDNRLHIIQNLDDIGQPFSCEQWSNFCGGESYDIVDDGNDYFFFDLFALDDYWHSIAILDHNMVFRYYCECNECLALGYEGLAEIVDGLVIEIDITLGDVNHDSIINIQDVILIINLVLSNEYQNPADLNSDDIVDVLDIVQLVNIILN